MKKLVCILLALMLLCGCGAPAEETQVATESTGNGLQQVQIQGEEVVFEPWEQEGVPTEGCYYLTQDVVLTEPMVVAGQLKLHLNGHTVTGAEGVTFGNFVTVPAGGELVIYDDAQNTGALVSPRSITAKQQVVHMFQVEGTVTIAGGKMDASQILLEDVADGAGFYVSNGGVLNVCDGTIIGGTVWCSSLTPKQPEKLTEETVPAGEVTEETVVEEEPLPVRGMGGSIYVAAGGLCNISGGVIQDGCAGLGGNLYVQEDAENPGRVVMSGGTILNGEAMFHAGNVYMAGVMEVSGGEIVQGRAYGNGGNLLVSGTLEMTGGIVREGRCDAGGKSGKRGGNILINGIDAVVHIANAQILDGNGQGSENFGGNICVMGQCAKEFTVTNTTISGGHGHRGGNVYIGTLAKDVNPEILNYHMSNVTISGGFCSYRGGNLCMDSDLRGTYINLTMDNCIINQDGGSQESISLGAGAAIDTWATVTMNGGEINGGVVNLYLDAVLTANGTKLPAEGHGGPGELVIVE